MGQYSSRDIGVGEDTAGEERVEDRFRQTFYCERCLGKLRRLNNQVPKRGGGHICHMHIHSRTTVNLVGMLNWKTYT